MKFSTHEEFTTSAMEVHGVIMEMLLHQDRVMMSEVAEKIEWEYAPFLLTALVDGAGQWTDDYVCALQNVDGKETGDVIIWKKESK